MMLQSVQDQPDLLSLLLVEMHFLSVETADWNLTLHLTGNKTKFPDSVSDQEQYFQFLPGKSVSEVGPIEFLKNDKNIKVPLASKILSLEGTVMVFFGENFITVKKEKNLKEKLNVLILRNLHWMQF